MASRKSKKAADQEQPKKKKKHRARNLFFVLVVGGAAFALSEGLRNKALDALFGKEEQFQYTPPATAGDGDGTDSSSAGA